MSEIRQEAVVWQALNLHERSGQTAVVTKQHSVKYTYLAAPYIYGEVYELGVLLH